MWLNLKISKSRKIVSYVLLYHENSVYRKMEYTKNMLMKNLRNCHLSFFPLQRRFFVTKFSKTFWCHSHKGCTFCSANFSMKSTLRRSSHLWFWIFETLNWLNDKCFCPNMFFFELGWNFLRILKSREIRIWGSLN